MTLGPGLEPDHPVRRGGTRAELSRLRDRPYRQLGARDAGRKAQVVLDPPRRPRLAAQRAPFHHQGAEPFGGAVHGCAETGRAAADDEQIDLLDRRELETDPQST